MRVMPVFRNVARFTSVSLLLCDGNAVLKKYSPANDCIEAVLSCISTGVESTRGLVRKQGTDDDEYLT